MHSKKILIIFLIFISIWCLGIISPVIFHHENAFIIAKPFLNQVYSTVCHQVNEKTISYEGEDLFVCSRCAGIYFGLFIVGLAAFFLRKNIKNSFYLVLIFSLIMLLDVSFSTIGVYSYSKLAALLTGLLLSSAIFLFVLDQLNYPQKQIDYEK